VEKNKKQNLHPAPSTLHPASCAQHLSASEASAKEACTQSYF